MIQPRCCAVVRDGLSGGLCGREAFDINIDGFYCRDHFAAAQRVYDAKQDLLDAVSAWVDGGDAERLRDAAGAWVEARRETARGVA